MALSPIRPTRAEICREALVANFRKLYERLGVPLWAVVKADAYGHGDLALSRELQGQPGLRGFAVSLVEEGVLLRENGIAAPILLMGPSVMRSHGAVVDAAMTPMVSTIEDLEAYEEEARSRESVLGVHLKVDTGMGRLGLDEATLRAILAQKPPHLKIEGLSSHFANADCDEVAEPESKTARQLRTFLKFKSEAEAALGGSVMCHIANSAGALRFSKTRFDECRIGIALYGAGEGPAIAETKQVMTLRSRVAQLREIGAGQTVGYESWFIAKANTRVAIIPIGYADGYPRILGRRAEVLIQEKRCPVIGAVSMDMSAVDVTSLGDEVAAGDDVVLLGRQGQSLISVAEFSKWAALSEYEVLCGISKRVPRIMV